MLVQRTLTNPISATGVGLHSGRQIKLNLFPADEDTGIIFRRIDLNPQVEIKAIVGNVGATTLATTLVEGDTQIATIEHLMSAFAGLGIDNVIVEVDDMEVPIMDGSASPFVFLIQSAGIKQQSKPKKFIKIKKEIKVEADDGAYAKLAPYNGFKVTYSLVYDDDKQKKYNSTSTVDFNSTTFLKEISRARTYGFMSDIDYMKKNNLEYIDIKDSGGNRKIIKAAAIELFDSAGKKMRIERDATSGKMKSRRFNAAGNAEADSDDVIEIAEDKSPQLGGTFETNGHLIRIGESSSSTDDRLQIGANQDLQLYHDGSNSYIDDSTGAGQLRVLTNQFKIFSAGGTETIFNASQNGSVELYHNNSKKLETTSTGAQTTGTLNVNGAYTLPTSDGSANQFLKTDGAGAVSFATVPQTVVEDTTPQLGGNLDVNGNSITSASNGDVDIAPHGTGNAKITSTGALILPVGTTAQRPSTPVVGMFRFNSTTDRFEGYNGASWVILGSVLPTNEATDYGATTETAISNHDYGAITDADSIIIDYKTIT